MAEDDKEDKTERATQKRVDDARKEGQVPRSQDLSSCTVLLAATGALLLMGGEIGAALSASMRAGLDMTRAEALDEAQLIPALSAALYQVGLSCAPVFAIVMLAALAAPMAIGGWNLSAEALAPKFSRLDPIAGFGRIFSVRGFVELGKALLKFSLVALVAIGVLWRDAGELSALGAESIGSAIGHSASMVGSALLSLAAALLVIAMIDVPFQLWRHAKDLRMSRDEIRQEHKESDGSPEVKGRIRQLQHEIAKGRMMQEVPKADVIVTNPTHFAVALRYDDKNMRAPIVIAKGTDLVALRIREIATEHQIPIVEAPPLARALHKNVELGREIPASLYVTVAQILTYVYQLRVARRVGAPPPPAPKLN